MRLEKGENKGKLQQLFSSVKKNITVTLIVSCFPELFFAVLGPNWYTYGNPSFRKKS